MTRVVTGGHQPQLDDDDRYTLRRYEDCRPTRSGATLVRLLWALTLVLVLITVAMVTRRALDLVPMNLDSCVHSVHKI